ncbi:hydroxymethylglutaryl-CoA synthase family protein [Sphingosinicella ginsenosidimutans]|uniref:3-hydroxy-3-methylglutaryl CoA synthase n=1 Tax=Allosphingosinicella ginsenosidimutans TaxID=1176539 RepID=A0A5C6TQC8_9SPHN|nr:3-oxoacyl-[acyl-carrier-protein] synthase III C-terminal domain-containing protein [Sphingosinicella ginsenosidimutans]TXC62574.1 3-hydroxy-3-methylglutaryl CoA synthase [Sphingosinicella ginsenosidimutans]
MTEVGIVAFGAYVPRLRLKRAAVVAANSWYAPGLRAHGKGERAMANWDEDAVTMAVEAARDCLTGIDRGTVSSLLLASSTAPFADRQNAGIVKEALAMSDDIATADLSGSQRAGLSAMVQGLAVAAANGVTVLAIGSDKRKARPASEAELVQGDAAAAVLLGPGGGVAKLLASHSVSADFVDHFRAAGEAADYEWEARWVRDEGYAGLAPRAIHGVLAKAGIEADAVDAFILPAPRGVAQAMSRRCGIRPEAVRDDLGQSVGHSGVAHPLLMLVHALERATPGQRILVAGFGNGCEAVLFEVTDAIASLPRRRAVTGWLARRREEVNYLKLLAFSGHLELETGMRAEFDQKQPLTALWRQRRAVLGLVGGRDPRTGEVQFPKSDIPLGGNLDAVGTLEDHPMAELPARILSFTADNLTYSPDPPCWYGLIDFEGGGRMNVEFCDAEPEDVAVGREMRMMFRVKAFDRQRQFIRYFWKAAPAEREA